VSLLDPVLQEDLVDLVIGVEQVQVLAGSGRGSDLGVGHRWTV
jgi:hypothetical protein